MAAKKNYLIIIALIACGALMAGCSSDSDSPTAVDTAPPAVPTGLMATEYSTGLTLRWEPNNMDADLMGFRVYFRVSDNSYTLVEDPQPNNWYVHSAPLAGCMNEYMVTSVDYSGNESAAAFLNVEVKEPKNFRRE